MTAARIVTVFSLFIASFAYAQDIPVNPSIGGYSPVSYFTEDEAQLGDPEFSVVHDGQLFYLTSEEQVAVFKKNPDRYRPRHRSCPYSLSIGMVLPLDPTNFKIIDDSLLLFHRSEEKDALLEWEASELSQEELLRRADANVFLIRF
ncbi:MAG: hypothetical protein AAF004_05605 [Pseudomonadota bacterium]